ncbi:MAG: hypothetical protein M3Q61_03895 [Chloroflexota bacterium]|nr:hypothetical protein [Chloroflexota bacterium]
MFNALVDDFDQGEPCGLVIESIIDMQPDISIDSAFAEVRRAISDGFVAARCLTTTNALRNPTEDDFARTLGAILAVKQPFDPYAEPNSLILRLTCAGRARWRQGADAWQRSLSTDGRIDVDPADRTVAVFAECEAMAAQLLEEWLQSTPGAALERTAPRVESDVHASLHPGFSTAGVRISWRYVGPTSPIQSGEDR